MKKILTFIFIMMLMFNTMSSSCKADNNIEEKYVDYKGVKIYTEAYNYSSKEKEAIIFLHGLGGNHTHGKFLYDESNPYMTITLDYLDHGNSGHVPSISWNTHVDSIKAVLDAYGIKKAYVVGHSFGADTAMMFANKYPNMVKDVVLLDRAYYNYSSFEQFNVTKNIFNILEYGPEAGLSKEEFGKFFDMSWDNDITKTWDIKKDVLLLGGNAEKAFKGNPSLAGIISMIKQNPQDFGINTDDANLLPNLTEDNVSDLVNFLNMKVEDFSSVNKRFSVIQTPFAHGEMVRDSEAMSFMRDHVIKYLKNRNK
ncbi:alpha/beta fold hydrolase [Clostridium sp. DJ247]|uniref:alpha/beta fold hydrolase n=1 Tax=Clostridium sp. DJ247 TaxID=2726188 RepID=UPI0016256527|nr:alpha/beta hydrolase [Clostridium sp. DJ247]MBC2580975.1 alpha/beta hydrolase [Clostridium sp. DJ247]